MHAANDFLREESRKEKGYKQAKSQLRDTPVRSTSKPPGTDCEANAASLPMGMIC